MNLSPLQYHLLFSTSWQYADVLGTQALPMFELSFHFALCIEFISEASISRLCLKVKTSFFLSLSIILTIN